MKKYYQWLVYLVILGVLVLGFITPSGIRGAWANNMWSVKFVNHYFGLSSDFTQQNNPPPSHKHATQFLIKQALVNNDYDSALNLISQVLDESNLLLMETYAQVLFLKGDYLGSFTVWEKLKQQSPLIQAVQYFRESGRNDLVESAYQSLYTIDPEKYTGPLVAVLRKNNKLQEGLDIIYKSINDFPDSDQQSAWLSLLGDYYRQAAEWDKAEDYYFKALEIRPDDWVVWLNLGNMYFARNSDLEKTIYCLKKVIEIVPERGVGYYQIGFYFNRSNKLSDGIHWFKIAAEKEPDNKRYALSYANALRDTNNLKEAFDIYISLVSKFPEDSEIHYEISWAYWLNSQTEKSIESIEKAIKAAPEQILYYFRAGEIYEKVGNTEKAKLIYERILNIDPNNSQASRKLNQINNP